MLLLGVFCPCCPRDHPTVPMGLEDQWEGGRSQGSPSTPGHLGDAAREPAPLGLAERSVSARCWLSQEMGQRVKAHSQGSSS